MWGEAGAAGEVITLLGRLAEKPLSRPLEAGGWSHLMRETRPQAAENQFVRVTTAAELAEDLQGAHLEFFGSRTFDWVEAVLGLSGTLSWRERHRDLAWRKQRWEMARLWRSVCREPKGDLCYLIAERTRVHIARRLKSQGFAVTAYGTPDLKPLAPGCLLPAYDLTVNAGPLWMLTTAEGPTDSGLATACMRLRRVIGDGEDRVDEVQCWGCCLHRDDTPALTLLARGRIPACQPLYHRSGVNQGLIVTLVRVRQSAQGARQERLAFELHPADGRLLSWRYARDSKLEMGFRLDCAEQALLGALAARCLTA